MVAGGREAAKCILGRTVSDNKGSETELRPGQPGWGSKAGPDRDCSQDRDKS